MRAPSREQVVAALRGLSFRARLTLVAAAAVALAIIAASAVTYVVVRGQLRSQFDDGLRSRAASIGAQPGGVHVDHCGLNGQQFCLDVHQDVLGAGGFIQLVTADAKTLLTRDETGPLPVSKDALAAARHGGRPFMSDVTASGHDLRVLTVPVQDGSGATFALQVAESLSGLNHTLGRIKLYLLLIAFGGIAAAAALGLLVSRAALAPVRRLTETTEKVTDTGDLSERIDVEGRDELSRLAGSFNMMLGALEESTRAQRQLVADASHELRTPLTSVRTNLEVLASERELPPGERERLLEDVVEQLGEMTTLIAELIELARGEQPAANAEEVRLDLVARDAVARTRRHRPGITFTADLQESLVRGVPSTIERAVGNLLDNAAKWSPPGGEVEIGVRDGTVTVRDHGPGIDEKDLPYVFDRFYRARDARGMPGSGLGLAIVRQVAEAHGGEVVAEQAEGGGTRMVLRLEGDGLRQE
jgi:two-component system, OmpR family, sensor histidine kinase MprB